MSKNKSRGSIVYSTNPDFNYERDEGEERETPAPAKQRLKVTQDSKQRAGKTVTLVQGFVGGEEELKELARVLKGRCGVGGSVKGMEIIIQGAFREKVVAILKSLDYMVK